MTTYTIEYTVLFVNDMFTSTYPSYAIARETLRSSPERTVRKVSDDCSCLSYIGRDGRSTIDLFFV